MTMPKPPTAVRSIRLTEELWATIQSDAEARGEKVNAVVARHLRIAYAPKDKLTVESIVDVTLASPVGKRAMARVKKPQPGPLERALKREGQSKPFVSRLKGEWKAP